MAGYVGYQGYDPERAQVDRKRQIAELLAQGAMDTSPKSFWEGAAQLGKAFIARGASDRADAADMAYGDTVTKRNAAALAKIFADQPAMSTGASTTFGDAGQVTASTPGVTAPQQPNRYRAIAEALAPELGLAGAIQAGQGAQRQGIEDARYADTTAYNRGRDAVGDQWRDKTFNYQQGRDAVTDDHWGQTFGFQKERAGVEDKQWGQSFGLQRDQAAEGRRHNQAVEGIAARTATIKPTPMQVAVDKNYASDLVDWQTQGSVNFQKNAAQIRSAIQVLDSGEDISGPASLIPGRGVWGARGKEIQQQVEEVVQTSLKQILGGQFTQKEGEGILARTFDPTQDEAVNSARAKRLLAQMELAAQQKNDALTYYNQNGTMAGYQGHIPTMNDFDAAVASASPEKIIGAKKFVTEIWPTLSAQTKATPKAQEALAMAQSMLGVQSVAQAPMPAAQPPVDLSQLTDEQLDQLIAQGGGR